MFSDHRRELSSCFGGVQPGDAAGNASITGQLLKRVKLGDSRYKNHLDGNDQMDLLLGKRPLACHELFFFAGPKLRALPIDDFKLQFIHQPCGWPDEKLTTDLPTITNLRQDPLSERARSAGKV